MPRKMEEIIGPFERGRSLPGTREHDRGRIRYVALERSDPREEFGNVVEQVTPPLVSAGGVILLHEVRVRLPDGTQFYPLRLNGDLRAWHRQIEQGARGRGVLSATIVGDTFALSDGRAVPLAECKVEWFG